MSPHASRLRPALRVAIAAVWLVNGLACKVLGLVPRHEQIVARILGAAHAHGLTVAIGVAEIGMALWILSSIAPRVNAAVQIALVLTMNLLEVALVPDLLLWGRFNMVFATAFCGVVLLNAVFRDT